MNRPWRIAIPMALMIFLAGASASPAGGSPAPQQRDRRPTVPGQMMPTRLDTLTAEAWDRTYVDYARTIVATRISAGALTRTDGRLAPAQKGAAVQIGMHRDLPAPWSERVRGTDLDWTRVSRGRVASLSVDSPGARATRLAVRVTRMPAGAELRFFEPESPGVVWGPYDRATLQEPLETRDRRGDKGSAAARRSEKSDDFRAYWSPVMRGDRVGVEIFLPDDASPEALVLSLPRISHLERSPYDTRDLSDVGASGSCQQDVACDPSWSTTNLAVAKEVFDADGGTYTCTGQLVANTSGDGELLFATANHCMSAQSETVSAAFFWFFQRSACNGSAPSSVAQTTGGADLLSTSDVEAGFDFTLMHLRSSPPGGVSMAGWTASAVGSGDRIAGIHHPAGDLKKLSTGSVTGFEPWGRRSPSASHIEVRWSEGVTEGGSSGSGLFLDGSWPNQPLVGVLTGGSSYCSSPTAPDLYGRLDRVYGDLEPWLDPRSIPAISPGQTLAGDLPRNGWIYRRVTVSGALDVRLETTSGDADLYLQRGLAPARDLYDCRSQEGGTSDDACSVGNTGGTTYVIGVLGYEASGFRLTVGGSGGGGGGDGGDGSGDGSGDGGGGDGSGDGGDGGDPPVAPATPTSASAVLTTGAIELSWNDASANEDGFRIDRQVQGGSWSQLATVGAGTTRLLDADVAPSTTYCYAVQAYNGAGASDWSNTTCATTAPADGGGGGGDGDGGGDPDPTTVPDRPNGLYLFRFRGEIDLVWNDNSRDEDGFHIYRRGGGQGWQRLATVPADEFYFFDETVSRRTRYCYVVRAFNAAGESANSNRRCIRSR